MNCFTKELMLGLMIGPVGPMTTIAYIPFTLIITDPNPVALGSLKHITITVSMNGRNGTRIPGTTIMEWQYHRLLMLSNTEHTFSDLTDSSGNLFYQMIISKYARPGQYYLMYRQLLQIIFTR